MNKIIIIAALLGLLAVSFAQSDGESGGHPASKATAKAMDEVKKVAQSGANGVAKAADGVTVKVERFTDPPAHQPQQHNIAVSALNGVGRLIRNVSMETGNFVGNVGKAGFRLATAVPAAVIGSVRESATRIASPRHINNKRNNNGNNVNNNNNSGNNVNNNNNDASVQSQSSSGSGQKNSDQTNENQDHANSENAAAPDELQKSK